MPQHYYDKNGRYVGSSVTTEEGAQAVKEAAGCLGDLMGLGGCRLIFIIFGGLLLLSPFVAFGSMAVYALLVEVLKMPEGVTPIAIAIAIVVVITGLVVALYLKRRK